MEGRDIYNKNGFVSIDDIFQESGKYSTGKSIDDIVGAGDNKKPSADKEIIRNILEDKVVFFKQILDDIDNQVKDRMILKESILHKLDERLCDLKTKIYEIETWGLGRNKSIDSRRDKLEKEIEALAKQKSEEHRESWRDIALLRKEHRQFSQQYRNAARKTGLISKLEENGTESA
ncbi:MAG: hypothetical protein AB1814_02060 [Thermodesulfobacteriota bacterium]